jgi:hypothetical protein
MDRGLEQFMGPHGHTHRGGRRALSLLRRHIYLEESFLFPLFQKAGYEAPVDLMLQEHVVIWEGIERVAALLLPGKTVFREDETRLLLMLLGEHNTKEESILYDRLDLVLEADAQVEFLRDLGDVRVPSGWSCGVA